LNCFAGVGEDGFEKAFVFAVEEVTDLVSTVRTCARSIREDCFGIHILPDVCSFALNEVKCEPLTVGSVVVAGKRGRKIPKSRAQKA
jgi:hypothetical protein